jgi:TfoX/Sxy family transcriptional regulator of competence genes
MATEAGFMEYVAGQLGAVPQLSYRRMFGEYAVYVGAKVVALVCDNQFFLKPTAAGRALLGSPVEAPPYPGARPFYRVDEQLDDGEFMAALLLATEREVPAPKPKRAAKAKVPKKRPGKARTGC